MKDSYKMREWRGKASIIKHPETGIIIAKVVAGDWYLSNGDERIITVLGSCVSACIRDPKRGVGGVNHFMFAGGQDELTDQSSNGSKLYGEQAMDALIEALLKLGCEKSRLEVKLFGGANMEQSHMQVGVENIDFALNYCARHKLNVIASDFGDVYPRKLQYNPITGQVKLKKLRSAYGDYFNLADYN